MGRRHVELVYEGVAALIFEAPAERHREIADDGIGVREHPEPAAVRVGEQAGDGVAGGRFIERIAVGGVIVLLVGQDRRGRRRGSRLEMQRT